MTYAVFVSHLMDNILKKYIDQYCIYIITYVRNGDENTLYHCSELGKQLAIKKCSVEDLVTFHQFCIESLGHSLNQKQLIKSFDLLTEITVQQTLWLKRETALKTDAQRMISDVIEAMPLSIYWKDIKGRYLGCNNAYLRDIGVSDQDEILNKHTQELNKDYQYIRCLSSTEADILAKNKLSYSGEREMNIACGDRISIKETILPLTNTELQLYGIICFYENITILKKTEQENQRLANNLNQSQRVESIGRLAGGIAHDFNNMLAVIIGYSQLIERGLSTHYDNGKYTDYLQRILSAADKSKLLTEKLLTFSRKELVKPTTFNLHTHITNALTTYATIIDEDIFISLNACDQYWIKADTSHIDQVILNLIVNARDAMLERCKSKQKRIDILLKDSEQPGFVSLIIKDNGCGMSKETKEYIFEPFFTTKKDIGTGLGLSTVFTIVTKNKGSINVNIDNEEGTEFIIEWPLARVTGKKNTVELIESFQPSDHRKTNEINICILEDDKQVRELLVSVLSSAGYNVFGYENSYTMFHELNPNEIQIHLLVTDIILSENSNGKQVSDKFSRIFPNSKVIFVSGYSNDIISKRGIILEEVTHIKKPFSNNFLISTVRDTLAH